jgi:hypothetical protein
MCPPPDQRLRIDSDCAQISFLRLRTAVSERYECRRNSEILKLGKHRSLCKPNATSRVGFDSGNFVDSTTLWCLSTFGVPPPRIKCYLANIVWHDVAVTPLCLPLTFNLNPNQLLCAVTRDQR